MDIQCLHEHAEMGGWHPHARSRLWNLGLQRSLKMRTTLDSQCSITSGLLRRRQLQSW